MNDYNAQQQPKHFDPCGPTHAEAGVAVNIPMATLRTRFGLAAETLTDKVKPKPGGGS